MSRVLLVDDEVELTAALSRALQRQGYAVTVTHNGESALALLQQQHFDLMILDWMLPERSGLELCHYVRQHGDPTPVLFLTARDALDDEVIALDAGADDYLVKPFELRHLLARVRALLRRTEAPSRRLKVGSLELDLDNQLAYWRGQGLTLSEKESQLLACLMQQPGEIVSHDVILNTLWPGQDKPSSNVLAAQVRLLRRKLEDQGSLMIQTVYGRGYRLMVDAVS
ncbi:MAG: response regulator transcription factor [Synechococcales cyanobacterium]